LYVDAMTAPNSLRSLHVELRHATKEEQPILARLLQLSCHDFSEFVEVDLDAKGLFEYESLPLYWSEAHRHPFLVRVKGVPAGFVFVKRSSTSADFRTTRDMAEFFIVRRYRRRGIGTRIAKEIFKRYLGRWEVRVLTANQNGLHFWERAIKDFVGHEVFSVRVTIDGRDWQLFSFASSPTTSK
jgi:predicted acetyltransferase